MSKTAKDSKPSLDSVDFTPVAWFDMFNACIYFGREQAQAAIDGGNHIIPVETIVKVSGAAHLDGIGEALLSLEARLMEIQPILEDQPKQDQLAADLRAAANISRCSEQRQAGLIAENAALRRHLQVIADQGPNFGPDGTCMTWRHWRDLAKDALAEIPGRT